jgi:ABC-type uncharacterized transport system auxiliary subunit
MRPVHRLALIATVMGCSIVPKAPPRAYYDLKYDAEGVQCARSYPSPVEVWEFSAEAPYDRSAMVVTEGREVSFSQGHQWVDRSGALVAGKLLRDLNAGKLFPIAVSPRDPQGAPLELTGDVYRFAWEKDGSAARASFEADVILRRTGEGAEVLLHKRYDLRSEGTAPADDAAAFAREMSVVVGRFSALLRHDLCDALSGTPSGGDRR